MREKIITAIEKEKIIVIVRGVEKENLIPLGEALYSGGIRLMEITYDAKGDIPDEETAENIRLLAEHFEGRMYIGAGTVLTEKQVELTKKAGGCFIISPDSYDKVIVKTRELGMVSVPGAFTSTEIQAAHRVGADFVKLFPVSSIGADYVKALKAPLSHIRLLAVGGINESNISEYLEAGVSGFGIGANIADKSLIEKNDFEGITKCAIQYKKAAVR